MMALRVLVDASDPMMRSNHRLHNSTSPSTFLKCGTQKRGRMTNADDIVYAQKRPKAVQMKKKLDPPLEFIMDVNQPQSSMESLHMKKGCMPMRKTLLVKKIDTKKSSRASVSEVHKKIRLETLQEEKGSVEKSFLKTSHELAPPIAVDNNKKTLLNWRQIKEERRGRDKQEDKGSVEKSFLKTSQELATPIDVDNNKKTLLNWRQIKEERRGRDKQEEKGSVEKLFLKTSHELAAPIVVDNNEKTLLNWRQIKEERRRRDIAYARLQARLQLDEMKDTAGLEHNREAQRDFEKFIGIHL